MKTYETHIETIHPDFSLTPEKIATLAAEGWVLQANMLGRIFGSGETEAMSHYVFYREVRHK